MKHHRSLQSGADVLGVLGEIAPLFVIGKVQALFQQGFQSHCFFQQRLQARGLSLGLDGQVLLPIDQKLQPFVPAPDQTAGVFPFHIPGNQPLSHQSLAAIGGKILQRYQNHFCARCPLCCILGPMQQAQGLCFLQTGTEGQVVHIAPQAYLGSQS